MKREMTLKELAEELGSDNKVRVLCEDKDMIVFTFSKNQKPLDDEYSFETGM